MSKMVFSLVVALPILALGATVAQGRNGGEGSGACEVPDEGSAVSWGVASCSANNFHDLDKQLNERYKILINRLSMQDKLEIRKSEREWIVFRNEKCGIKLNENPVANVQVECLSSFTRRRLEWINDKILHLSGSR